MFVQNAKFQYRCLSAMFIGAIARKLNIVHVDPIG